MWILDLSCSINWNRGLSGSFTAFEILSAVLLMLSSDWEVWRVVCISLFSSGWLALNPWPVSSAPAVWGAWALFFFLVLLCTVHIYNHWTYSFQIHQYIHSHSVISHAINQVYSGILVLSDSLLKFSSDLCLTSSLCNIKSLPPSYLHILKSGTRFDKGMALLFELLTCTTCHACHQQLSI